jgi:hypothetical protein
MTFLLFSCSDYHPNFTRENPDACSQICRGGKAYAAVTKKTNKSKSHTAEPQSISNSPSVPPGVSVFARTKSFPPSIFEDGEKVRRTMAWHVEAEHSDMETHQSGRVSPDPYSRPSTKIRSSSTSSPAPIPPLDSQTASHHNEQLGTIQAPLKLMEAICDLIDDDAVEPIPLSRIEGIQPASRQLPDEQTTLSSAEHGLSIFEPRVIEDMLDDQPSNTST